MKKLFTALAAALLLLCALRAFAQIEISEVLASNGIIVNGRSDDWLELRNTSPSDADISGWHLSNTYKNYEKFTFPAGTVIPADGYLLVYCDSGSDTAGRVKGALCAPFGLSASGRILYLSDAEGNTVQEFEYPAQYGNVSYGVTGQGERMYFEQPTPGKANTSAGYAYRAPEPVFVTEPGLYTDSVYVKITCEEGYTIRYTTDCSTPGPLLPGV